jgi:hypothetical protein
LLLLFHGNFKRHVGKRPRDFGLNKNAFTSSIYTPILIVLGDFGGAMEELIDIRILVYLGLSVKDLWIFILERE